MSTRRLVVILSVPPYAKKVFNSAPKPATPEERLWRERAARMTLDALGHTNLTMKKTRHNEAVRYARRWFRGIYEGTHEDGVDALELSDVKTDSAVDTFDAANLTGFTGVRDAVLAMEPILFPDEKDEHLV